MLYQSFCWYNSLTYIGGLFMNGNTNMSVVINGFFIENTMTLSPATVHIYRWGLNLMCDYLHNPPVKSITPQDLSNFFVWLSTRYTPIRMSGDTTPLTPRSVENAWTAMRSFFNWATNTELVKNRPDKNIQRPKYKPAEVHPFTTADVEALLKACKYSRVVERGNQRRFQYKRRSAKRDTAIIALLLDTGVRVSEATRIRIRDINFENGEVFIRPYGTGQKTTSRTVVLGKRGRAEVYKYVAERNNAQPEEPLFLTIAGHPMDRNSIRLVLNELGKRASILGVHPHRFRHTFAIMYLRNGGNVFTLKNLLGHSTLRMAEHYLEIANSDVIQAHRLASPFDNLGMH
jgi:integrase/recombinase XerD